MRRIKSKSRDVSKRFSTSQAFVPKRPANMQQQQDSTEVLLNTTKMMEPLPLPLGQRAPNIYTQFSYYPSSQASEQRTLLEACIAGGHLFRAKTLYERIRSYHDKLTANQAQQEGFTDSELNQGVATMQDLVPISVHTALLRAFFRKALANRQFSSMKDSVEEAWDWYYMLIREYKVVGRPTAAMLAVMIKGSIVTTRLEDDLQVDSKLLHLLESLSTYKVGLQDVLDDPIFDSEASASLGSLSVHDAFEYLSELVENRGKASHRTLIQSTKKALLERGLLTQEDWQSATTETRAPRIDPLEGVPPVRPTLKQSQENEDDTIVPLRLDTLRGHLFSLTSKRKQEFSDPLIRQTLLEESAFDAARMQREKEMLQKENYMSGMTKGPRTLQNLVWEWTLALGTKIRTAVAENTAKDERHQTRLEGSLFSNKTDEYRLLNLVDPDKMAFITITSVISHITNSRVPGGVTVATACYKIGVSLEKEYRADILSRTDQKAFDRILKQASNQRGQQAAALGKLWKEEVARQEALRKENDQFGQVPPEWSQSLRIKLGARLLSYLVDETKIVRTAVVKETQEDGTVYERDISEEQPAFHHSYQYVQGTKLGVIKANQALQKLLEADSLGVLMHPRTLPMVVPPRPWQSHNVGCYMIHQPDLMRIKSSPEQRNYIRAASNSGALTNVFAALDYLGSTPWVINRKVFDVVSKVWNSGEAIADIPVADPLLTIKDPEPPKGIESDIKLRNLHRVALKEAARRRSEDHSSRCSINYQLEIARAYIGETLYFPHNVDFRGRAYPIPPNLSHIGNDLCRGLLQFAEEKPLGERGFKWLKVHMANLAGYDKASLDARAAFTDAHREDIMDSAENPLSGKRWWLKAEDPWQCLAVCFDLTAAWRSGNPAEYKSRQPVHQDGTCNGLQHYAALGGDRRGAEAVNLIAGDKPADVYGRVAALVADRVAKEAAEGNEDAKLLDGLITRKVVKQTVMTVVYGVTFIGAIRMVSKQLATLESIPKPKIYSLSIYVARLIFASIGDLFAGATRIQKWFSQCAALVCRASPAHRFESKSKNAPEHMTPLIWTSPLGLPIVQPYREPKRKQVVTALQTVYLEDPNLVAEVDSRSQASAFPPNYVHSLDATHMMLTAIEAKRKGIAFASVHDSFWTHACDVDTMNEALRSTFVQLHSQALLERLREELLQRYAGYRIPWREIPVNLQEALGIRELRLAASENKRKSRASSKAKTKPASENVNPFAGSETPHFEMSQAEIAKLRPKAKDADLTDVHSSVLLSDILPKLPKRGDFEVSSVSESKYFFS